jgi:hypothetical protein
MSSRMAEVARAHAPAGLARAAVALAVTCAITVMPMPAPVARAAPAEPAGAPSESAAAPEALGWETVALEGATCGLGAPFKYFLNPAEDEAAGLLIFMMGGGACMKEGPAPPGAGGVAEQLHCMNFGNFGEPTDTYHLIGSVVAFLNRLRDTNPYRAYHYAFIPYCTGDVHVGSAAQPYDYDPSPDGEFLVVHRGRLNVLAVLDDLQRRFPEDRHVVVTGSSAGGMGAIVNYPEAARRWPGAVLVPDAGIAPPAPGSLMARYGVEVADRWRAAEALPDYCRAADCLTDTLRLLAAHAAHFDGHAAPWRPFGYLQGQQDGTLSDYLEIGPCTYELALRHAAAEYAQPNLRAYVPATAQHTFLFSTTGFTLVGGVPVWAWFAQVAAATAADELPADAVDRWLACNPLTLPALQRG